MIQLAARSFKANELFNSLIDTGLVSEKSRVGVLNHAWQAKDERSLFQRVLRQACDNSVLIGFDKLSKLLTPERLWVVLNEVFVAQDYSLPGSFPDDAVIFDCGANVGMASAFFKLQRPNATITAFEPTLDLVDAIREMANKNSWANFEIVPAAVSDYDGKAEFLMSKQDPLGGSLTSRKQSTDDTLVPTQVDVVRLKEKLPSHLDLLKLDIEGSEYEVIKDIQDQLPNIDRLFVEYHRGPDFADDRLETILKILREKGFSYILKPNWTHSRATSFFDVSVLSRASMCIYASQVK